MLLFRDGKFNPANAFIGFQTDTPAAIVFQTTHFMRQLRKEGAANSNGWENVRSANALGEVSPEGLVELEEDSEQWKYAVSNDSNNIVPSRKRTNGHCTLHWARIGGGGGGGVVQHSHY